MSLLPERSDHNQTISTPSGEIISIRAFREIHDQIVKSSQKINKQFFDNLLLDINNIKNGGPGFCFAVYRWDGQKYDVNRYEYEGKACSLE